MDIRTNCGALLIGTDIRRLRTFAIR